MSEMLPDSERIQELKTRTSWNDRSYVADAAPADANWTNRWVDIVQTAPSVRVESGPTQEVASPVIVQNTEPMVRPYVVVVLFVCFGMVLMMACTAIIRPTR